MKSLQIHFEDEEFKELSKLKIEFGSNSWKELILTLINNRKKIMEISNKYFPEDSN